MHTPDDVERGRRRFNEVMRSAAPASDAPFVRDGVVAAVFGDLWTRDGLPTRDRRLISITCACMASVPRGIEDHIRAALASGDITLEEMREFVLHFAYYAGWPKASLVHHTLTAVAREFEAVEQGPRQTDGPPEASRQATSS
jgi:4-carboxymuconolactone decarboxylase